MIGDGQYFNINLASETQKSLSGGRKFCKCFFRTQKKADRYSESDGGDLRISKEKSMEWKKAFDRIMDQLYNHPEEMRTKLLGKYNTPAVAGQTEGKTAIELLQSLQRG